MSFVDVLFMLKQSKFHLFFLLAYDLIVVFVAY